MAMIDARCSVVQYRCAVSCTPTAATTTFVSVLGLAACFCLARRQHCAVKNTRTNIIKYNLLNDTFQVAEISFLQKLELCEPKVEKGSILKL